MSLDSASSQRAVLSPEVFQRLRTLIQDETGIHFRENKRYLLESQVGRRLRALDLSDFESYLRRLENGSWERERKHLISAVTINETSFFRHPAHYQALREHLLPDLIENHDRRRVRFWSAACSTGDEPYSLAILIQEHIQPRYPKVEFEIMGTDIDASVLEQARRGIFSSYAVRKLPAYAQKYFSEAGENKHVLDDETVRQMVTFRSLNLTAPNRSTRAPQRCDILLCANVLIYFNHEAKRKVINHLHRSISPHGYLLVGVTETLSGYADLFKLVRAGDMLAYQKKPES